MEKEKRKRLGGQTVGEEIGNSITHGIACLMGIVGMILLLIKSDSSIEYLAALIFGISMSLLYLSSCLFHSFKEGSVVKSIFQRFDHLSIYLLIGGTFAPILLCLAEWPRGLIFFIVQWTLILVGVVLKAINTSKHHVIHIILYLAIGWSGLFFLGELSEVSLALFWLILSGGIVYSVGILFYIARWKFAHFVWHFFCIAGTLLHFIGIYLYIF